MENLTHKTGKILLLLGATALLLVSCTESIAPIHEGTSVRIVKPDTVVDLEKAFSRFGYDFEQLHAGIPPLIVGSIPSELSEIRSSSRKKTLFFQSLLPMILLANNEIAEERSELLELTNIIANNQSLQEEQLQRLATLQKRYSVTGEPTAMQTLKQLKSRIDQVPAELALAQAANESAWGTSRFSQLGNNLFGEWTFTPGTGIIPEGRPEGATYEVRRFASLYDSIHSYLRNLNTHSAYADFRQLRSEARERGETPDGITLAEGLTKYSTRRMAYVHDLQNLIRQNNLQRFARASLRQG
jgi:Bax protein